jgi:uncharacterized YccA/Bax inhibitor family protein
MIRTSNPTLSPGVFAREQTYGLNDAMTIQGTINKCFILFFLLLLSASWVWGKVIQPAAPLLADQFDVRTTASSVMMYVMGGGIGGFILALITVFNKSVARVTAPLYALCQGLVLGGISAYYELTYPGMVIQAVALTFGTMFCMLTAYKSGMIQVNNKFVLGVVSATGAIALVYLVSWIMSFFGVQFSMIHGSGMFGIIFSFIVVGIAAMNLVLDFYMIEEGASSGAHKYMEWYGAFALMVTLIWLYMEILRLLAKLRDRR